MTRRFPSLALAVSLFALESHLHGRSLGGRPDSNQHNSMSDVPADLKPIGAYLARAKELATAEPVISYWGECTLVAQQKAVESCSVAPTVLSSPC